MTSTGHKLPHPIVWTILYFPFGALGGFVTVALTFLATRHHLSITEGAMLGGASLLSQWLKWTWAPIIDVTLTPKRWYVFSTIVSAAGVVGMAAVPLSRETLGLLLAIVAVSSLLNSIVGMSVEAIMAAVTPPEQVGRTSAWFQAGNLGGTGIGGGLGIFLLQWLPAPWMAGAVLGALFLACNRALRYLPDVGGHRNPGGPIAAVRAVFADIRAMAGTKGGLQAALLCFLPIGTGAASGVLTQASVAARWGAHDNEVALLQGFVAGGVTTLGCFGGGWLCQRFHPRVAYAAIGLLLAAVAVGMAVSPANVYTYIGWNMLYTFVVGLAYAAFTALVLGAIGSKSGATKYNLFASFSNFPIWWLGLTLGRVADLSGPRVMLWTEAGLGILGVAVFALAARYISRTTLPDTLPEDPVPEVAAKLAA